MAPGAAPSTTPITQAPPHGELLAVFARHPRQILTRECLCELAHDRERVATDRSMGIRIARLRKKIEADPSSPSVLRIIRGQGDLFEP